MASDMSLSESSIASELAKMIGDLGALVKGLVREPALLELARLLEEACRQRGRP